MATNEIVTDSEVRDENTGLGPLFNRLLAPLASLKLTVGLFAASIFIILAGTLAQVNKDIWQVIDEYFRTAFAWIEFQVFLPPSFYGALFGTAPPEIPGGFYFPGGWLIGATMCLNLLAAHLVRFKVQARGWRLISGLLVTLFGMVLTALVVLSANNPEGLQTDPWLSYDALWVLMLGALAISCAGCTYAWWQMAPGQRLSRILMGSAVLIQAGTLGYFASQGMEGRLSDSGMRIMWQLTQGGLAAVVLLAGCILVFRQRGGMVLLHGGIGLMMFGELLVGLTAVEGQMHIQEGETVNFVQDIRTVELAVVDRSDKETDKVTVIPRSLLLNSLNEKKPIVDDRLPFRVEVVQFLQNSNLMPARAGVDNPATAGLGREWVVQKAEASSGTDTSSEVDMSAAYVAVSTNDGKPLGTYLVGIAISFQNRAETIKVGDAEYEMSLRFQRHYKPYKFQLLDVRKDDYLGTTTPRNYSSELHLVDSSRQVDRNIKVWMNNPLRFAGETFYQSGYHMDPQTQIEGTTLQVVTNTGWMIPYVSCMLVAVGMLAHFAITLLRFLQRSEKTLVTETKLQQPGIRSSFDRYSLTAFPLLMTTLAVIVVAYAGMTPRVKDGEFNFYEFGKLPIVAEGRAKPIDTLARSTLLAISGKQAFKDINGKSQPATRWLLDVVGRPDVAFTHKVFQIPNFEVQELVGLKVREHFRYAPEEFLPKLAALTTEAEKAHSASAADLTLFQKKVLELEKKIGILDLLMQSFNPPNIRPESARDDLMAAIGRQQSLLRRQPPLAVPPTEKDGSWETFASAWTRNLVKTTFLNQKADEPTEAFTRILVAYANNNPKEFNAEVAKYQAWLSENSPPDLATTRTDFEAFFNRFRPFMITQVLYVLSFILCALAWLGWSRPLNRAAIGVTVVAFGLHCFALIARMYISGRPPVTNLYSSAVFIGWGCVALGLLMNLFYRNGVGTVIAAISGFLTLGVADFLGADGDTFVVLQAVLDTQFWLATHVTCITFGYATTYVAGLLGIMYVIRGVCTPSLTREAGRDLYRMIYGSLCFSILFSFVGTVLGGLWADDSWGRFWGWDPKENGALIIVLWNALALHARWGGMVKERGLAQLAVAGNIAVTWSWFGVNELGIGLHSYGFREGMIQMVAGICGACLLILILGALPKTYWWSEARHRS